MQQSTISCFRCVGGMKICKYCAGKLTKHGHAAGKQRYKCKGCCRTQVDNYSYNAYQPDLNKRIIQFTKEGLGIRSIARVLSISTTTLLKRIKSIADNLPRPIASKGKTYEVDEIRTFIKRKDRLIWIVYALERTDRNVVSFYVGARTNKTLNVVLKTLQYAGAKRIYTDSLQHYRYLVERNVHCTDRYGTNHIERKNLTLRTHLKRLNRRTICFSRSIAMLTACLTIYFYS